MGCSVFVAIYKQTFNMQLTRKKSEANSISKWISNAYFLFEFDLKKGFLKVTKFSCNKKYTGLSLKITKGRYQNVETIEFMNTFLIKKKTFVHSFFMYIYTYQTIPFVILEIKVHCCKHLDIK